MMAPSFSGTDSKLIADLHALSKKSPKLVKSSTYSAPADPQIIVRSWKMNEFKYYDIPSPFPTLARGIFTVELSPGSEGVEGDNTSGGQKYRIVARGYDKFFNIGEVPWTTWPSLETHTAAPYTLSLKSNGCIIFIAALTPTKLLITSKHSIGPVAGSTVSHAQAGETWLRKYLERKGRTEADLATRLWENNWTAIAELCDDSFEEHVLGYAPEQTGLHLHGLNESTKEFKTLSHKDVDAFAEEWGFITTDSITMNSISEVREFTDEIGRSGKWNGEAVEGFVVRTHVIEPPAGKEKSASASPYAPGSSFFFKVKFDEPYMMYRDWREVTKSLLSSKGPLSASKLPKSKMKRAETKVYVRWVIDEINKDRQPFAEFTRGKGIIATRERFLKWLETEQGKGDLGKAQKGAAETVTIENQEKVFGKTIIVPVAVPGCGKTAVSIALAHIFGFGHTQSDDVHVKKAAPQFIKNVTSLLQKHDVVIADKNNHLRQHRQALRDATSKYPTPVRLLSLNWSISDKPQATIHRICGDRIVSRGDNHQTLRADPSAAKSHEEVIWMFINTTEDLAESEVDAIVEMDMEEGLEAAVHRAVDGCVAVLGLDRPSEEKIQEAIGVINGYAPAVKKPDTVVKQKGDSLAGPRYYGLLAEVDLQEVLGNRLGLVAAGAGESNNTESKACGFWEALISEKRVARRPHVTIVHRNSLPGERTLWKRCGALQALEEPPLFKGRLGNVVWNDRVMAVTVDDLEVVVEDGESYEARLGHELLEGLPIDVMERLHITVGTKNGSVPAVEAKALVESWRKGDTAAGVGDVHSMPLEGVRFQGRIKGLNS